MSQDLSQFRQDVRNWLGDNFPKSLIGRGIEPFGGVEGEASIPEDASSWRDRLGEKGWGTPTGPLNTAVAGSHRPKQQFCLRKCMQPGQSTRSRYSLEWG